MKNIDSKSHMTGKSVYVDDVLEVSGTYHAVILTSPVAHGRIIDLNTDVSHPDLIKIITYKQIPGDNQVGGIIPDEELLAEEKVHYVGQPIAVIVATTLKSAYDIRDMITLEIESLKSIIDPKIAYMNGDIIGAERRFKMGDPDSVWVECDLVVEGSVDIGGQEHLYLETQGAYVFPKERGYRIISSTQGPTAVQRTAAKVLGINMMDIEVDVQRLGGGFGGKEDQATPIACMATLASYVTGHPVKLILDRQDDIKITGKRHPYLAEYKIGMKGEKIHAYSVMFYQNAGASADLSPAVLERTLFHATNSYFVPNVQAIAASCRTNLPPNTAFRGFGGPQGMIVIEAAIEHIAQKKKVHPYVIQEKNLLRDGDIFPYGQHVKEVRLQESWAMIWEDAKQIISDVDNYNRTHKFNKMGYAFMPISFGISFTNTSMNQASALVNVYSDGSIGVSTGAVEMGQGVNTRILQTVAEFFKLPEESVKIETTNTTRAINTSPTAASSTHDLNGKAVLDACNKIKNRLEIYLKKEGFEDPQFEGTVIKSGRKTILWDEVIKGAFLNRIDLAAHGYYATPVINFNKKEEKGHPFAYHTFGTAMIVAKLDCIRGISEVDTVLVAHDSGKSMNTNLDLGQVEGGLVQGLGWMLLEDVVYDAEGVNRSGTLSTYKVPDINFAPNTFITKFLDGEENRFGLKGSKAIGEPPLMYAIAGLFAVRAAMREFRDIRNNFCIVPLTSERIFMELYGSDRR